MGAASPISEDCLYLNVVTTAQTADDRQPVMVFFHGGGLTSGTGNSTTYNHPKLPSKGVVVVTVNSRLGPIGYLAHPALSAESEHGVSGNYGALDLKASLEWVQANIEAFGGDPGNVTIFGESGGGTKTISQMASPLTKGLFHKAIVESGSALVSPDRVTMLEDAEATGAKLVAALGIDGAEDVAAAMRGVTWEALIEAARKEEVGFQANVVVDGHIIPDTVNNLFREGRQHDVPLIVGANEGERSLQTNVPLMANLHSASASSSTYVYNFSHLPKGWREEEGCVAFHGLELTYVFGAVPIGLTSPTTLYLARGGGCSPEVPETDELDFTVADNAVTIWAQFARTSDPSVPGLIDWPAYTEADPRYLDIGGTLEVGTGIENAYVAPPPRE
jgi:para-nitrobenzyl esterase